MMDFIFQKYLPTHPAQGLLLEARWYAKSLNGLAEVVSWAKEHGVMVVVFGPVAEYNAPLPRLLAYAITWRMPNLTESHRLDYSPVMDSLMQNLAENRWHVCYVSLYRATCERGRCVEYADELDGIPMLSDTDHLSQGGSRLLITRLLHSGKPNCLDEGLALK
jgi:hypothetical protein